MMNIDFFHLLPNFTADSLNSAYYDRMNEVRRTGNYEQWARFFLEAFRESASDAVKTIDLLTDFRRSNEEKFKTLGRSTKAALNLFYYLEANPIIEIQRTSAALHVTFNTVSKAIDNLVLLGILKQNNKAERYRTFSYEAYLDILREGT
jgi:Fic family protein